MRDLKIYTKPPKQKYSWQFCSKCGLWSWCTWHHIYRRRYGEEWCWLCVFSEENNFRQGCHDWVHANPAEARDLGLYKKQTNIIKRMKKKKGCKKHMPLWDRFQNKTICQFCRQEIKNPEFMSKIKNKVVNLKSSKKKKTEKMKGADVQVEKTDKYRQQIFLAVKGRLPEEEDDKLTSSICKDFIVKCANNTFNRRWGHLREFASKEQSYLILKEKEND